MFETALSKNELYILIDTFNWNFEIGRNVKYNLDILFELLDIDSVTSNLNKPISVISVSVIEGILIDLIVRLDEATNHYPKYINAVLFKDEIKQRLESDKKADTYISTIDGNIVTYKKIKNYGLADLVKLCRDYKLLGSDDSIYLELEQITKYRNRLHIRNYFQNFERSETGVFSNARTQKTVNRMIKIVQFLSENYHRTWK